MNIRRDIKNDSVDPQSLAAMEALESAVCNQNATGASEAEPRRSGGARSRNRKRMWRGNGVADPDRRRGARRPRAAAPVRNFIFDTLQREPGALDYIVRGLIRPALAEAGIPWYGLHAFRRGLATNLHELGVADIVIQAILRHSNVSVTRAAYVLNDAVDPQSLAAMKTLESAASKQNATAGSDGPISSSQAAATVAASNEQQTFHR